MSEDTPQGDSQEIKNNVLTLIPGKRDNKGTETEVNEDLEWVYTFIEDVMERIITESVSEITGISIVVTHRDGGVSHAHKCEREGIISMIGAMEMKKLRIASTLDLEKR